MQQFLLCNFIALTMCYGSMNKHTEHYLTVENGRCQNATDYIIWRLGPGGTTEQNTKCKHQHYLPAATSIFK